MQVSAATTPDRMSQAGEPFDLRALEAALQRPTRRTLTPAWTPGALSSHAPTTPDTRSNTSAADYLAAQGAFVAHSGVATPQVAYDVDDDIPMGEPEGSRSLVATLVWALVNGVPPNDHVEALLQAGVDVNAADEAGTTPLHVAAAFGDVALLARLAAVPSIDLQPRLAVAEQQTPRQLAEECGMGDAAQFLAEREDLGATQC